MQFPIKNRFNGEVQFTAEIETDDNTSLSVKLGLAVKWAFKTGAYLGGAYLRGADLGGADLRGVDLGGADLGGAHLRGAYLRGADLRGADLGGAYFRGADLDRADLSGADLGRHKLAERCNPFAELGTPNNWYAYTYLTEQGVQRVSVGCRDFTIPEARAYWASKPNRREVMASLDYAEAIARVRDWGTYVTVADWAGY